jgi:hypothetical protein
MRKHAFILVLTLALLICAVPYGSSAHPPLTTCKEGGEMYGYWVDCGNHQADGAFTWNTSIPNSVAAVDYPYRAAMTSGAARWNNTGITSISLSTVSSNNGNIYTYSDPNTSALALFHDYGSDASGHLTKWKIKFNKSKLDNKDASFKAALAAHELGHAIGLNDLYLSGNTDKLMYGYFGETLGTRAAAPTDKDKLGAVEATRH